MSGGRRKQFKKGLALFLKIQMIFILSFGSFVLMMPQVRAEETSDLDVNAASAVVIDAKTGQILYANEEDVARPPASMSKMMTELLVMEAIKSGKINWDDMVTASAYAAAIPGSGGLVAEGSSISVRNLFRAISIYSSNDASVLLAEHVAGTEEKFVQLMNERAKEIGLSDDAYFINATGLDRDYIESELKGDLLEQVPSYQGETLLTAKDAALIAREIVIHHPEVLEIASQTEAYFIEEEPDERELMRNWNRMLDNWGEQSSLSYPGLDGLKTGFTDAAGNNFTGTAERDGMRLISVVMGTESETARFAETAKLLDYGFDHFEPEIVLPAKSAIEEVKTVPVHKGSVLEVPVVPAEGVEYLVHKDHFDPEQIKIEVVINDEEKNIAPIVQGDVLGRAKVSYDSPTGTITQQVDLIASEDVEKAGWFKLMMRAIKNFFIDLFNGIKNLF